VSEINNQTLGRYQIVSLIARGGTAEVYKAYQPGLDRYVAVKLLHPHLADEPGFVSRFEREAASVARLRHPTSCRSSTSTADGATSWSWSS
jgi:serine/threonine-protein kinase